MDIHLQSLYYCTTKEYEEEDKRKKGEKDKTKGLAITKQSSSSI